MRLKERNTSSFCEWKRKKVNETGWKRCPIVIFSPAHQSQLWSSTPNILLTLCVGEGYKNVILRELWQNNQSEQALYNCHFITYNLNLPTLQTCLLFLWSFFQRLRTSEAFLNDLLRQTSRITHHSLPYMTCELSKDETKSMWIGITKTVFLFGTRAVNWSWYVLKYTYSRYLYVLSVLVVKLHL